MAKDLRSFAKGKKSKEKELNIDEMIQKEVPKDQQQYANVVKEQVKNLSGKSESELMDQLMQSVNQGKKDGSFSPAMMEQFAKQVSPMLNGVQKQRLNQIMNQLKK